MFGRDPAADPPACSPASATCPRSRTCPAGCASANCSATPARSTRAGIAAFAEELRTSFALDPAARVKHLSKGQRARAGLVLALAHRPELLVLDEPSSGLDPIVRRDILGAIIRTIADEGRTVLFSSHLLHEVERVADRVALIDRRPGRLQRCARRHQGDPPPADAALPRAAPTAARARRGAGLGRARRGVGRRLQRRARRPARRGRRRAARRSSSSACRRSTRSSSPASGRRK